MSASDVRNGYYDGNRAFTWLAELSGFSVDVVNFLICQLSALFLASLFRSVLHPSKVSSAVRHTFALVIGLLFGYMCFGKHAIHIAGLPAACYIVIRTQSPAVVQRNVLLVAMTYLLCIHLIRQIYDYGSESLDVTGPLMIITQKVTSLAFSIHDGFVGKSKDLTKGQQYHAVYKMPTALEYFSYVFNFQSLLAGPLVFYKDYIEFIEGYNLLKRPVANGNLDNGSKNLQLVEPSPTKAVVEKVIGSIVCAFIFMKFDKLYPVKNMKDDDFLEQTSMGYKLWYAMMATTTVRFKFYHAWLLADAICNNSGLGFTGYSKEGYPQWDLISNIHVLQFELASNMRQAINSWNCGTNRWLRSIVYDRVPKKYGTVLTFALSAVWHGFYPGYYLTFATGALVVTAARLMRRMFRHRFQQTQLTRMFYDIVTVVTTRFVMGYCTFPFVMLEFMGSIKLYLKLYLCLHVIGLFVIFILPKFIRGERSARSSQTATVVVATQENEANKNDELAANAAEHESLTKSENFSNLTINEVVSLTKHKNVKYDDDDDDDSKIIDESANDERSKAKTKANNKSNNNLPQTLDDVELLRGNKNGNGSINASSSMTLARDAVSVQHDECEIDQLSNKIKEKIDAETKNIEEFIDKTVTETVSGIVEFKKDLMRRGGERNFKSGSCIKNSLISQDIVNGGGNGGAIINGLGNDNHAVLRKRNMRASNDDGNDVATAAAAVAGGACAGDGSGAFLKKEIEAINAVVQQANVLPAVLSNGHAK